MAFKLSTGALLAEPAKLPITAPEGHSVVSSPLHQASCYPLKSSGSDCDTSAFEEEI